jgi:hypothetical protein
MSTNEAGLGASLERSPITDRRGSRQRRLWSVVTHALVAAAFAEAVLAGAMLSGAGWARALHGLLAAALVVSTIGAGLFALATLRRSPNGRRFALTLLGLAATVFLQVALGVFAMRGANLLWLHVPLGAALVAFAARTVADARQLE